MRCFVTGATGAVGRPLVRALRAAGHEVRGVARTDARAEELRVVGAEPVRVDLFDEESVVSGVAGCDAIVHFATNVPPLSKVGLPWAWKTHNRLRTETTRHLLAGARQHGIGRVVKESITFTYPDRGDEWIDESVEPDESVKPLRPTLEGERLVGAFTEEGGEGVVLRFGLFYGPGNRAIDEALRTAKLRAYPIAGRGTSYMSSIHVDDAASAAVAALTAPPGLYNVVDDEPVTRREYVDAFSAAFDLPRLRIAPWWLLRAIGGAGAKALYASQRVSNGRFREVTGWGPAVPDAGVGWAAIGAAHDRGEGSAR
ncbi:MAG: NAD(P)-dependent oxidoreductase [Acidimicrobiia bacterium]